MIATEIRIGTTDYTIEVYEGHMGRRSVRLIKPDGEAYDVDKGLERVFCNCPHWRYRLADLPGDPKCKHIEAVIEAGLI